MGTKFWGFCLVVSWAGTLALMGMFSAEVAAFFGTVTGAFFGFQAGRERNKNGKNGP